MLKVMLKLSAKRPGKSDAAHHKATYPASIGILKLKPMFHYTLPTSNSSFTAGATYFAIVTKFSRMDYSLAPFAKHLAPFVKGAKLLLFSVIEGAHVLLISVSQHVKKNLRLIGSLQGEGVIRAIRCNFSFSHTSNLFLPNPRGFFQTARFDRKRELLNNPPNAHSPK